MTENDPSARPSINRRRLMTMGSAALAGAGLSALDRGALAQDATPAASPPAGHGHGMAATPEGATPAPPPTPFNGVTGEPLAFPEVHASESGLLDIQMEVKLSEIVVAGQKVQSTVYEQSFPGPTWSVWPGDTIKVRLINSIDAAINNHTHGFHVSPKDNSDNIFLHINPGETFDYEYHLPDNHPSGLYWYHPHAHGLTAQQTTAGMVGAIIIKGGLDEIEGIAGLTDQLLFLQSTQFSGDGQLVPIDKSSPATRTRFINGQLQPVIACRPGETQRWRIANASADDFFLLSLEDHAFHVIAKDGNPYKRVVTVDEILLAPAERVEVLIQASTTPGTHQLKTLPWGIADQAQPDALLATLDISGEVLEPQPLPVELIPFEDLSLLPVDHYRTTVFQQPGPPLFLAIDGKHFDPNRIDQTVKLGALEEWTVKNTGDLRHPFHIHINDFQIVAINGQPVEANSLNDTVNLPPQSEVTIRMRFADFDGKFVYHCHILSHEDFGMMATVEVVP